MLDPLEPRRLCATTGLDPSYGTAGQASVPVLAVSAFDSSSVSRVLASAFTPSGAAYVVLNEPARRLVGSTFYSTQDAIVRLTPAGVVDTTFGDNGHAVVSRTGFAGYDRPAFAVSPAGRIVLQSNGQTVLLDAAGRVLPGATHRVAAFQSGLRLTKAYGAAIDASGRIYLAGTFEPTGEASRVIAVARYTSDGTLDSAWGDNGYADATDAVGTADSIYSLNSARVALSSDGHLVAAFERNGSYSTDPDGIYFTDTADNNALTFDAHGKQVGFSHIADDSAINGGTAIAPTDDLRAMPDGSTLAVTRGGSGVGADGPVLVRIPPTGNSTATSIDTAKPYYSRLTPFGTVIADPSQSGTTYPAYQPAVGTSDDIQFADTQQFAVLNDGRLMDAAVVNPGGKRPTLVVRRFDGTGVYTPAAAGTVALQAATRTLDVAGTNGNDTIFVRRRGDRLRVRINNGPVQAFDAADVDTILIHGDAGNDAIDLRLGNLAKAVRLSGGAGRDTLLADHADATLDGGPDNDYMRGHGYLDGGDGDDQLFGFGLLRGGPGDDILHPFRRGFSVPAADD